VILSSYCEEFSLDISVAKAISCGFAGGMRCGETCGVITAAIMVIGLWSFQKHKDETEQKKLCFEIVSKFLNDFIKIQNCSKCKEIIGYDIRDVEERKKHPGQQRKICPLVIKMVLKY
jgi:C_GCAxxG_C_C family probable redox protein